MSTLVTMNMSSKTLVLAGVTGLAFVCYCIYFDNKRRSDPNFRKKLKEKRRKKNQGASVKTKTGTKTLPNLKDPTTAQKFFMEEIKLGEQLLATGEIEEGIDHICQAVAVCNQPEPLLQLLQQTLPGPAFQLLLHRLPIIGKEIAALTSSDFIDEDVA